MTACEAEQLAPAAAAAPPALIPGSGPLSQGEALERGPFLNATWRSAAVWTGRLD